MKILFVGFGWPPKKGGGAITYTYDLTKALAKNGLKIAYFYNGEVSPRPFTYLKKVKKNNVKLYKLMNSPNSYLNFSDSQKDIANKKIETIFSGKWKMLLKIETQFSLCTCVTKNRNISFSIKKCVTKNRKMTFF